jgi:hypothetical protein
VPVSVQVLAVSRVVDPASSHSADPDPVVAAVTEVEAHVAHEVAHTDVRDLLALREHLETRLPETISLVTAAFGVHVERVEITDIEVGLTMSLLEALSRGRVVDGA